MRRPGRGHARRRGRLHASGDKPGGFEYTCDRIWLLHRVLVVQVINLFLPVPKVNMQIMPKKIEKMVPQFATRKGWTGYRNREGGPRGE